MSAGERLRLGLVGCGRLAERAYAPAIARSGRLELVSACDPSPRRRTTIAASAGQGPAPATFATVAELLAGPANDAVVIASPVETHVEAATAAGERGLPCLVEKPPAACAREAERLAALSPAPAIAFNRRLLLGRGLRERIPRSGGLTVRARIDYRRASWDAISVRDDALLDLGSHLVDLALWLTAAEPLEASCELAGPDRAALRLATSRGTCELRCSTAAIHRETVVVRDGDGVVASRRLGGALGLVAGRLRRGPDALAGSVAEELELFAAAVAGEPAGELGTAAEGARVMRVLDAARRSARLGGAPVAAGRDADAR
ncbi:MAG: Gfo/Idh/MocA family oxidoreductase, partial [Thermoleophilia bacterium]|nr:Gfo/Idh/MocA family oxidoreductase [Thermoleophilia bacterium]